MRNFHQYHTPINTLRVYTKNEQVFAKNNERDWSAVQFKWVSIPFFNL